MTKKNTPKNEVEIVPKRKLTSTNEDIIAADPELTQSDNEGKADHDRQRELSRVFKDKAEVTAAQHNLNANNKGKQLLVTKEVVDMVFELVQQDRKTTEAKLAASKKQDAIRHDTEHAKKEAKAQKDLPKSTKRVK